MIYSDAGDLEMLDLKLTPSFKFAILDDGTMLVRKFGKPGIYRPIEDVPLEYLDHLTRCVNPYGFSERRKQVVDK